jgi:hypothetical protein
MMRCRGHVVFDGKLHESQLKWLMAMHEYIRECPAL